MCMKEIEKSIHDVDTDNLNGLGAAYEGRRIDAMDRMVFNWTDSGLGPSKSLMRAPYKNPWIQRANEIEIIWVDHRI